jgi:hypothetical protein
MTNILDKILAFPAFFKAKKAENHAILIQGSCLDPDNHPSNFPRILPKDAQ